MNGRKCRGRVEFVWEIKTFAIKYSVAEPVSQYSKVSLILIEWDGEIWYSHHLTSSSPSP